MIITIKRSGVTPIPPSLASGELAYSWEATTGGKLYIGWGDETVPGAADNISAIGGKYYTDKLNHTPGVLTANAAIIVDSSSTINQLKVSSLPTTNPDVVNLEYLNSRSIGIAGDTGSGSILLTSGTLSFSGVDGITTSVSGNTVNIGLAQDISTDSNVTFNNVTVDGTLFSNDITAETVTISGNLNVTGNTTIVNTEEIHLADNIILLNSNLDSSTAPTQSAGIEINRGSSTNVSFLWDEGNDQWTVGSYNMVANEFIGTINGGTY